METKKENLENKVERYKELSKKQKNDFNELKEYLKLAVEINKDEEAIKKEENEINKTIELLKPFNKLLNRKNIKKDLIKKINSRFESEKNNIPLFVDYNKKIKNALKMFELLTDEDDAEKSCDQISKEITQQLSDYNETFLTEDGIDNFVSTDLRNKEFAMLEEIMNKYKLDPLSNCSYAHEKIKNKRDSFGSMIRLNDSIITNYLKTLVINSMNNDDINILKEKLMDESDPNSSSIDCLTRNQIRSINYEMMIELLQDKFSKTRQDIIDGNIPEKFKRLLNLTVLEELKYSHDTTENTCDKSIKELHTKFAKSVTGENLNLNWYRYAEAIMTYYIIPRNKEIYNGTLTKEKEDEIYKKFMEIVKKPENCKFKNYTWRFSWGLHEEIIKFKRDNSKDFGLVLKILKIYLD